MRVEKGEGYTDLGMVFYELRKEEGLNIQEQSKKFGLKYSYINSLNAGARNFSAKLILKIMDIYEGRPDVQEKIAFAWIPKPKREKILEVGTEKDLKIYFFANTGRMLP